MTTFAWYPTPEHIENANLTAFMRARNLADFDALMQRSTEDVPWFTDALLKYLQIEFYTPYTQVVDLSGGIQWPQWCLNGEMNIVHNCLDKYIGTPAAQKTAFIWEGEEGESRSITYEELYRLTNRAANALRSLGVGKGDAVGVFMPMTLEIVAALMAIAKIGAVIVPLFSGYGVGAVVTRLKETRAKALFTADGFFRRGRVIDTKSTADQAAEQLPALKHIIVLRRNRQPVNMTAGRDHWWHDLVLAQPEDAPTERTRAEDTLMVIYTSGTTGRPKGAVHTHCGFPVKGAQDMAFGMDLHPDEVIYWITDMGWMMGPWLVFGALILGATALLYDGAMDYPAPDRLWSLVSRHQVNKLGLSPTLIRALMPHGDAIVRQHDLSSLRMFGSTGGPWNDAPWMWLFENVGGGLRPIINYSGGTEISGGILMGNPLLPIKPSGFPAACPGIAADVFDETGKPVVGQVGELVIKAPWIGMTRGFWQDPERYIQTYWSRWENIWVHGDWAMKDEDGQWYLLGRSDDTIKVAGKRLGPAEMESVLVAHPQVVEAAVIGVPDEIKGSAVVAFCVLRAEPENADALRAELKAQVVQAMGKALAPKEVLFIPALPMTRNAKVMRRIIRAAYLGQDPGDITSLVNPEAVEAIRRLREGFSPP